MPAEKQTHFVLLGKATHTLGQTFKQGRKYADSEPKAQDLKAKRQKLYVYYRNQHPRRSLVGKDSCLPS
jgi:hypothetical protein